MYTQLKWVCDLLVETVALDIIDLCYMYLPKNLKSRLSFHEGVPKRGILIRIASFIKQTAMSLRENPIFIDDYPKQVPLFFALTNNQDRALRPLTERVPGSFFVGMNDFGEKQLPMFWAYIFSLPFMPIVIYRYFRSAPEYRQAYHYVFDTYWLAYGYYILMRWLLYNYQPTVLVLANDHMMWTRALIQAAAAEKIKTIYIQHASVTERFPPLNTDYAFLEGIDAAEKYAVCGKSETKVYLVGLPRFDKYYCLINKQNTLRSIGVCVGIADVESNTISLIEVLTRELPDLSYVLRPHPGDSRIQRWNALASKYEWLFSDSREEDAFQFLSKLDAALAGDSNILLEAALMNVLPIYYDFSKKRKDWYGFYKNGLVEYFSDPEGVVLYLKALIRNGRPNARPKARRYCVTIQTKYDGRSTQLTSDLICQIANGQIESSGDKSNWHCSSLGNLSNVCTINS